MRQPTKQSPGRDRPKPQKRREKPQATGNRRLAEQTRKILGKHSHVEKYRERRNSFSVLASVEV